MLRCSAVALLALTACTSLDEGITDDDVAAAAALAEAPAAGVDYDAQIALWCPGADRAAGVPSYRGLAGTFTRLGLPAPGEPSKLSFAPTRDEPDAAGAFTGRVGTATGTTRPYAGAFRALPDNPAIGAVIGLDIGGDGTVDQTSFVLALRRSPLGTLTGLCLAGRDHPFLLSRTLF